MSFGSKFYLSIKNIRIAHEYVIDRAHKCEYPRGRGSYGLIYAIEGGAEYRFFSGERISVSAGDVLFLTPSAAYSIAAKKEFKHYTVNFDLFEECSRLDALNTDHSLLRGGDNERIERIFKKLIAAWQAKNDAYEMRSVGLLYELMPLFYLEYTAAVGARGGERLLPAKEYIEQHYRENVSLDALARLSNMSMTNFRREWKRQYAETPLQYRDGIRLYYALEYLESGYYSISEIAEKCGFEDVSYFVRFFKKKMGVTPGRWHLH